MTCGVESVEWRVEGGEWPSHAAQSAAARQLLGRMLGDGLLLEHDSNGAPYLPQRPGLHVSISHCRTAVAVAVSSRHRVGIDIERRRRTDPGLMQRVCTSDEADAVRTSDDPAMAFLQLWTRKEAVLKCRGTGIRGFGSMVHALEADGISVADLPTGLPDTVAALAVATDG